MPTADLKHNLTTTLTILTRGAPTNDLKSLTLHTSMVCPKSAYLSRLAQQTTDIKLLELDADAFSIFAAWAYGGKIDFDVGDGSAPFADEGDILASVLECYTLSLSLEAPGFGNAVLDRACEISKDKGLVFGDDVINEIFRRTSAKDGSLLRRWIVEEWVWQFDCEGVGQLEWSAHRGLVREFLFEVVGCQAARLGRGGKWSVEASESEFEGGEVSFG
ncbi:hypothetical protein LTR37_000007 [Vermiconidia calcicola]|uniref:Uncharacterized protein n=1 Tax=Vermiconidia calcicola TaxID=1690605 RepID=A0ACC3P1M2_9PEZI|nr:hypothetical protein LTR37_000007 [Vermiconidia calcicola]